MKQEILAALDEVEHQHVVRVLLAVESGSRAWGFASLDSDYDVRFIYVHSRDWYLRIFEQRDVIEPEGAGCRWIERTTSQPPTEFERLVDFVADETEKSWIAELLQQKAEGCEGDRAPLTQQRLDIYTGELTGLDGYAARTSRPTKASHEPLDAILRQWAT